MQDSTKKKTTLKLKYYPKTYLQLFRFTLRFWFQKVNLCMAQALYFIDVSMFGC